MTADSPAASALADLINLNPPLVTPRVIRPSYAIKSLAMYEAWENFRVAPQDGLRAVALARQMLAEDPENLWALVTVAAKSATTAERTAILREALRVGFRRFGAELQDGGQRPDWKADPDAFMFLGAVVLYGKALSDEGLHDDARRCVSFLVAVDPEDLFNRVGRLQEAGYDLDELGDILGGGTGPGGP